MDSNIKKYKKTPKILKSRKPQAEPRQVQNQLRRHPWNLGKNLGTQEAHQLFAKHLFESTHDSHIYNEKEKKETIDTLLMGGDSDTWWKAIGNELGRLANGIDNRVRATNTI